MITKAMMHHVFIVAGETSMTRWHRRTASSSPTSMRCTMNSPTGNYPDVIAVLSAEREITHGTAKLPAASRGTVVSTAVVAPEHRRRHDCCCMDFRTHVRGTYRP